MQLQMLQVHGPEIKLHQRTADRPAGRVATLRSQKSQQVIEHRTADDVGDNVDGVAAGGLSNALEQVALSARDDCLRTDRRYLGLLACADDGIGDRPARAAELDDSGSDSSRGAGDKHSL